MLPEILQIIESRGPISFSRFMETALYHPEGYYTGTDRPRVGRHGDFFTSVSIGPLFGRLLARRLHAFWETLDRPEVFHILEPGPEGGQLALDILSAARADDPDFHQAIRYHACEPAPAKRELLRARFEDAGQVNAHVASSAESVEGAHGAVVANEILDALPVHLVTFRDGRWVERRVTAEDQKLAWIDHPIGTLATGLASLGHDFADGYTTEICLGHEASRPLAGAFEHAMLTFIDYGFSRAELCLPSRSEGTLRTYDRHQAGDDPLEHPGSRDITAHVDFTSVLETGRRLGLQPVGFTRHERYLTALAEPVLRSLAPESSETASFVRRFQTLTHPAMLGAKFHVLEFVKDAPVPACDPFRFDPRGLAHLDGPS